MQSGLHIKTSTDCAHKTHTNTHTHLKLVKRKEKNGLALRGSKRNLGSHAERMPNPRPPGAATPKNHEMVTPKEWQHEITSRCIPIHHNGVLQ